MDLLRTLFQKHCRIFFFLLFFFFNFPDGFIKVNLRALTQPCGPKQYTLVNINLSFNFISTVCPVWNRVLNCCFPLPGSRRGTRAHLSSSRYLPKWGRRLPGKGRLQTRGMERAQSCPDKQSPHLSLFGFSVGLIIAKSLNSLLWVMSS